MTEPITIGVDHGYAAMKTAHCSFPSGLAEYEHEPYTQKNVLCYDGKYYVIGSGPVNANSHAFRITPSSLSEKRRWGSINPERAAKSRFALA